MKTKLLLYFFLATGLCACISKQDQSAALEAVHATGAAGFSMKSSSSYSSGEGSHKTFELTLTNPKDVDNDEAAQVVTSLAALVLSRKMDSTEGYDQIRVEARYGSRYVKQTFKTDEVKKADRLISPYSEKFCTAIKQGDGKALRDLLDSRFIPDSSVVMLDSLFGRLLFSGGRLQDIKLIGFSSFTNPELGPGTFTGFWLEIITEKKKEYVRLLLDPASGKGIGINVNDSRPRLN
jgi:hypothetical protein